MNLKSISIGNGVTSLRGSLLYGCSYLENLTIPFVGKSATATTAAGDTLFGHLFGSYTYTNATKVNQYYKSGYYYYYYLPKSLKSVTVTGGNLLYGAFYNCSMLASVTIGNGVENIGQNAFYGCSGITSVTIGNGVENIGQSAFCGCSGLTEITISDSVTSIGSTAFYGCSSLTSIVIPDSVTSIGSSVFSGCSGLTSITIPFVGGSVKASNDTYQYPLGYVFGTNSYTGGTKTQQFYYGPSTNSTTRSYYYIPSNLKTVVVTGGNILYGAFYGCTGLTSITIPEGVTSIGPYAFDGCSGLTEIVIPDSVITIDDYAFYYCKKLTSIEIPDSVTSIGDKAFYWCTDLTEVVVDEDNQYYCSIDGILYDKNISTLIYCPAEANLTSITIPNGVTSISDCAFENCDNLTSVTIPNGIINIGERTFYNCTGLTSITIPDSVITIDDYAFCYCTKLTSITIPSNVTSIGHYAFQYCDMMTSITFKGTTEQWSAITKGNNWNHLVPAAEVICSDGTVAL